MMQNPIFKKEESVTNRGFTLPIWLTGINAVMTVLVLINLYSVSQGARETGEIRYASFLNLYHGLAAAELLLVLLAAPILTASAITGERERHTLPLLLATQLRPADIVLGKMLAAASTLVTMGLSTLPIMMTIFIYGGIEGKRILLFLLCFLLGGFFGLSVGMLSSCFCKNTATAAAVSCGIQVTAMVPVGLAVYFRQALPFSDGFSILFLGLLFMGLSLAALWGARWRLSREGKQKGRKS